MWTPNRRQAGVGIGILAALAVLLGGCSPSAVPTAPATAPPARATAGAPASPPPPRLTIQPDNVLPGDYVLLTLSGGTQPTTAKLTISGLPPSPGFFRQGDRLLAFVGIPPEQKPGKYPLSIWWPGGAANATLVVTARKFTEDHMQVSQSLDAVRTDQRQVDDDRRLNAARAHPDPNPAWSEAFLWPVHGEITTPFGEMRYVKGQFSAYHTGLDIAARAGTPVLATAAGRVVLAESLVITGNTVVIDHGLGVFSFYGHMSHIYVDVGQTVGRGDRIGAVGSTGFSTGPHLHWTMSIGNVAVDPYQFADQTLLDR